MVDMDNTVRMENSFIAMRGAPLVIGMGVRAIVVDCHFTRPGRVPPFFRRKRFRCVRPLVAHVVAVMVYGRWLRG